MQEIMRDADKCKPLNMVTTGNLPELMIQIFEFKMLDLINNKRTVINLIKEIYAF